MNVVNLPIRWFNLLVITFGLGVKIEYSKEAANCQWIVESKINIYVDVNRDKPVRIETTEPKFYIKYLRYISIPR